MTPLLRSSRGRTVVVRFFAGRAVSGLLMLLAFVTLSSNYEFGNDVAAGRRRVVLHPQKAGQRANPLR